MHVMSDGLGAQAVDSAGEPIKAVLARQGLLSPISENARVEFVSRPFSAITRKVIVGQQAGQRAGLQGMGQVDRHRTLRRRTARRLRNTISRLRTHPRRRDILRRV